MAVSNHYVLQAFPAAEEMLVGEDNAYGKGFILNAQGAATATQTAGNQIVGVVIEGAPTGETIGACTERGAKVPVRAGAVIAAGAILAVAADGRFATVAADQTGVAIATEAAAAADAIITAVLV